MVEIAVGGGGELQCPEADIVESLVIDKEGLIGVLNKLVNRQSGIVRLKRKGSVSQSEPNICQVKKHTSTTVSETLGLGTTEYVHIIRSGDSSLIFEIRRVPIPAPVPPPRECVIWKPELLINILLIC